MLRRWAIVLLVLGCARVAPPEAPAPAPEPPPPLPPPPPVPTLYTLDEALHDALSGPLTYLGMGLWTGSQRVPACGYRNERVLVVDVYCTINEVKAFRVDVYSPQRGRVRIYAEGKAPISSLSRRDYFSFNAETEPPPGPHSRLPSVALTMSFDELRDYDGRRYREFLPTCYGGVEIHRPQGGCHRELARYRGEWNDANRGFLRDPPEDWYRLIRELRELARQHGRDRY
jgi:hypothetical protein